MTKDGDPQAVLEYWRSIGPQGWFRKDDAIDSEISARFGALHARAAARGCDDWRTAPHSCLALIIVLDQFSRNMFRNDARAFARDSYALDCAREALRNEFDRKVEPAMHHFLYMPFMHAESIADQRHCVALFHADGDAESLKYAIIHHDIIRRFGRFPHRNAALGRHTTPAEKAFLDAGGFSA